MRRLAGTILALTLCALPPARAAGQDVAAYVDPMIGTLGSGFVFPGPAAPYGMVQLSPDTEGYFAYTGYLYSDEFIRGFSHVHVQSMGVPEGGNLPFMPTTGPVVTDVDQYMSAFSHAKEEASAGYYRARLLSYGIDAELTAGVRVGMHRYTFPANSQANVLIDAGRQIPGADYEPPAWRRPGTYPASVQILDSRTVAGTANPGGVGRPQHYPVHFVARFDRDFAAFGVWDRRGGPPQPGVAGVTGDGAGAYVTFSFAPYDDAPVVTAKVGVSFVSVANALENLESELPADDFDFDALRARTRAAWEDALRAIVVEGGTEAEKRSFYTALYHVQHHPNVFSDLNGEYLGHDRAVHRIGDAGDPMPAGSTYYANFSLWDTYRAHMPLMALIAPDRYRDMMRSLAAIAVQGGRLPRWSLMNGYPDFMPGEPALQVIADGYCRGLVPPEALETLYGHARRLALETHRDPSYLTYGYVPHDVNDGGGSATLEHAQGDFALALVADGLGKTADRDELLRLARNWRNLLDPETRFIRPRMKDGSWMTPYLPESPEGFVEGTGWQYTWLVSHDVAGLVKEMGRDLASQRLDEFFAAALVPYAGPEVQQKITLYGIGYAGNQYAPSNEHDLQAPWLYAWTEPWKAQALQRSLQTLYRAAPDGLPGNDDLGTMSAWFVWSALGFYPVTPGSPTYAIGSPLFERAAIRLPGGTFTVEAPGASLANKYVQSVALNGAPHAKTWFTHAAFQPAGSISFEVGPLPNASWGSGPGAAPPSQTGSTLADFACAG